MKKILSVLMCLCMLMSFAVAEETVEPEVSAVLELAADDVLATLEVMKEMEAERDDLISYVNLFGYNPKYGIEGKPIGTVTYKPQGFEPGTPLYL